MFLIIYEVIIYFFGYNVVVLKKRKVEKINMHCVRKVNESLTWVGADDRKIHIFEGIYPLKRGMSYNSYLLKDEKTVLLDTVDKACLETFLENVKYVLDGRKLDYVIVHHMEPDHSATLKTLLDYYPEATVVCNQKILNMIYQFFGSDLKLQTLIVNEGDTLNVGEHTFHFVNAPMVHWPEVMMSYESKDKILFSADAFGTFGALNGALFSDEVEYVHNYLDEARRYYTNIVGKYGPQVQAVLKKASALDIKLICPLHGFVFRKDLDKIIDKYLKWSSYTPEEKGVLLVYSSVYGHTENAANILACQLVEKGLRVEMFDLSLTDVSEVVANAFKYSHLVLATTTYNMGMFLLMDNLLHDLISHNLQNRTIAIMENGSWAPQVGKLMKEEINKMKNMTIIESVVTIKSSVTTQTMEQIVNLAHAIEETF